MSFFLNFSFNWVFIFYVVVWIILVFLGFLDGIKFGLLLKKFEFDWNFVKEFLVFLFLFMLMGILDYVFGWIDFLMLGYYFGFDKVGFYNGVVLIVRVLFVVLNFFGFVFMFMVMVFFIGGNIEGLKRLY